MKQLKPNRFLLLLIFLGAFLTAFSQSGTYFMTHYNPAEYNFDNSNFDLEQDERGVMHIANRQGVLHYDGNGWWLTPMPFSVYCLAEYEDKTYVGGRGGLGYITRDSSVVEHYIAIDTLHRDVQKLLINRNHVYYMTDSRLFTFNIAWPDSLIEIETNDAELLDLRRIDEKIFLTSTNGLLEVNFDNTLVQVDYAPEGAFFIRKSKHGRILFLTDSSQIYTQYEGKVAKLDFKDQDYLDQHTVTEIVWATDSLIAISTLSGGILFVDVPSGETLQIIDYDTGLPDNQILHLYLDNTGGLWATHDDGFTVISPQLPLRSFNHYPGLKGSLIAVLPNKNGLYVGTSLGVFRLAANRKMKKNVVYDRVRVRVEDEEASGEIEKERRGLFKRKKKKAEPVQQGPKYRYIYRKRIIEEEVSRSYEFQKVGGIDAKTIQLMAYKDLMLAGTVQGLYQVEEDTAYLIDEIPVLNMFGLPDQNLLFVSTVDEEVRVYERYRGAWRKTKMLEGLNDYIDQITLDPEKNIWLCGADSLYRIKLEHRELADVEVYHVDNPHFDRVYSVNLDDLILFINSSGYFAYSDLDVIRLKELEVQLGLPRKFILGSNGELLINTGNTWYGAGHNLRTSLNFLSFLTDPVAVARDDAYNYWIATASDQLYKINLLDIKGLNDKEEIYLKEVRSNDVPIAVMTELDIDEENSQLTFEFASPDYTGIYRKEYQFRLSSSGGTRSTWSAWSPNNNLISYQFLPPGIYTLEVRFRNTLGKEVSAEPVKFRVIAPYWKRPWFYVLEVLFFGGMLMFSYYMNHGRGKYGFISRLLGFLTLILVVEFFQTVAEYYYESYNSPVINFFIQAFIALVILPVETVLRKVVTREHQK